MAFTRNLDLSFLPLASFNKFNFYFKLVGKKFLAKKYLGKKLRTTKKWWAGGGEGEFDNFLSLSFGGKFSHKLDHFWPN